jgi:hypothetical protein
VFNLSSGGMPSLAQNAINHWPASVGLDLGALGQRVMWGFTVRRIGQLPCYRLAVLWRLGWRC